MSDAQTPYPSCSSGPGQNRAGTALPYAARPQAVRGMPSFLPEGRAQVFEIPWELKALPDLEQSS